MSKTKLKRRLKPYQAFTFNQICSLPRDNVGGKGWWAILDNGVVLCNQKTGEPATAMVTIPRREFERLARWYLTGRMSLAERSGARG